MAKQYLVTNISKIGKKLKKDLDKVLKGKYNQVLWSTRAKLCSEGLTYLEVDLLVELLKKWWLIDMEPL